MTMNAVINTRIYEYKLVYGWTMEVYMNQAIDCRIFQYEWENSRGIRLQLMIWPNIKPGYGIAAAATAAAQSNVHHKIGRSRVRCR